MTKQKIPAMNFSETKSKKDCDVILQEQAITTPSLLQKASQDLVVKVAKKQDKIKYDQSTVDKAISIYNSRFSDPSKVTYDMVTSLGRDQFTAIKQRQSAFTETINTIQDSGVFYILQEFNKNVKSADIPRLYRQACTVKPSIISKIISFVGFNSKHKQLSVDTQRSSLFDKIKENSTGLATVVNDMERKLMSKRSELRTASGMIKEGFSAQFEQLDLLAPQHLVVSLALENQEKFLEHLDTLNKNDGAVQQKIKEALRVRDNLVNRELLLRNSIISVPTKAGEYGIMLDSITSIMTEIDNTLDFKLVSLNDSLISISIAMKSQRALSDQYQIENLSETLSEIKSFAIKELAVQSKTLSSSARLKEANDLEKQVQNVINIQNELEQLETTKKQQFQEASAKMEQVAHIIQTEIIDKSVKSSLKDVSPDF